jgi:hypothetical protein
MRAGIVGSGEPTTHEITNAGCKKALKMVGKREREREREMVNFVGCFFFSLIGRGGRLIDVGCNFLSLAMIVSYWDAFLAMLIQMIRYGWISFSFFTFMQFLHNLVSFFELLFLLWLHKNKNKNKRGSQYIWVLLRHHLIESLFFLKCDLITLKIYAFSNPKNLYEHTILQVITTL